MSDISFESSVDLQSKPGRFTALRSAFVDGAKRFRVLHLLGLFTLVLSFPIAQITGNKPDFATVGAFAFVLLCLFVVMGTLVIIAKFFHMAIVERPESPTRALISWVGKEMTCQNRMMNSLQMLIAVSLFMVGFAVLKGAIAVLHPFSWDTTFMAWDRALHFGALPHEWLMPVIQSPAWVSFFNLFYNLWYFVLLISVMLAGASVSRSANHMRYLIAFMVTWLVPGFFIALAFSSAGPCFYERAGYGDTYVPLMQALNEVAKTTDVWALPTQNVLWDGFVGARDGSAGISAFPSLHVATAVLIALYTSSLNRWLGCLAWAFAAIIMVGSVVLGWHYAVDGYASGVLVLGIWWAVNRLYKTPNSPIS